MKKIIYCLVLFLTFGIIITGCSNNDTDDKSQDTTLSDIDNDVSNNYGSDYEVSRDDVKEAVNYIYDNIDKVDDDNVAKKLYEKGSYLELVASKVNIENDNAIKDLGVKTKDYASRVYSADDDKRDDIVKNGKDQFNDMKSTYTNSSDSAIDEFMDYFK